MAASLTFTMDERKYWPGEVERIFNKFWQLKLPVPVDPVVDIYRAAYTDAEWDAMQLLLNHKPGALSTSKTFSLYWTDDTSGGGDCPHATFRFGDGVELPDFGVRLHTLPDPIERKVRHWVTNVQAFRSLAQELRARCEGVMGNATGRGTSWITRRRKDLDPCVNTPGQLFRLWPEIQPLMKPHWKRALQLASVKSPLPDNVGYYKTDAQGYDYCTTPEQFRCESIDSTNVDKKRFKQLNHIILMLSLADKAEAPKGYPVFHGTLID